MENEVNIIIVLIFMALLLVIEIYVIFNIQKMPSLNIEMKNKLRSERISYFLAIFITQISTILYATQSISLQVNFFISVLCFGVGLTFSASRIIMRLYQNNRTNTPTFYSYLNNQA